MAYERDEPTIGLLSLNCQHWLLEYLAASIGTADDFAARRAATEISGYSPDPQILAQITRERRAARAEKQLGIHT